jgi:hypothetical protein
VDSYILTILYKSERNCYKKTSNIIVEFANEIRKVFYYGGISKESKNRR